MRSKLAYTSHMSERELTGEEALLAAGSVLWDKLPAHLQEAAREKLRRDHPETVQDANKAERAGCRLPRESGAQM